MDAGTSEGARLSGGLIGSLTGVVVLALFMLQNREDVTLSFLWWSFSWPLWLFTLVVALLGAFVWIGTCVVRRHRRSKARRDAR